MALEYLVAVVGSRGLIEDRIHSHVDILTENGSHTRRHGGEGKDRGKKARL